MFVALKKRFLTKMRGFKKSRVFTKEFIQGTVELLEFKSGNKNGLRIVGLNND